MLSYDLSHNFDYLSHNYNSLNYEIKSNNYNININYYEKVKACIIMTLNLIIVFLKVWDKK